MCIWYSMGSQYLAIAWAVYPMAVWLHPALTLLALVLPVLQLQEVSSVLCAVLNHMMGRTESLMAGVRVVDKPHPCDVLWLRTALQLPAPTATQARKDSA